jgi:hypothetical protein
MLLTFLNLNFAVEFQLQNSSKSKVVKLFKMLVTIK